MNDRYATVSRGGFACCRWTVAVLVWWGLLARWHPPVLVAAVLMAWSAIATVRAAPLVTLYTWLIEQNRPARTVELDVVGMRLAHAVAALAIGLPWLAIRWGGEDVAAAGWRVLAVVAVFKTAGAIGYCPVSKLFTALTGGRCCPLDRDDGT